ncbi:MAG: hypothetical protein MUE44_17900 [Oscillatoriaceae cyanobacterium Prado104]|jgi:hypothetical protein|nr:hypothetical protein [Oscillatoriaceae cyanobacterium Prado104]
MLNSNDEEKARNFLKEFTERLGTARDRKFTFLFLGRTRVGKLRTVNTLKASCLMTTLIASVGALVAIGVISETALALPRREIYKISDINQNDIDVFCRGKYGDYTSARLDSGNDVVICASRQLSEQNTRQTEFGTGGATITNGTTNNGEQWIEQRHHLSEVCEHKHPHKGTWVGDGGRSCYDSYWKW